MKLMIASDLHGSAYYCRALLESFRREEADRLVLLGDLLYHGPRNPLPREYDTVAVTANGGSATGAVVTVTPSPTATVESVTSASL